MMAEGNIIIPIVNTNDSGSNDSLVGVIGHGGSGTGSTATSLLGSLALSNLRNIGTYKIGNTTIPKGTQSPLVIKSLSSAKVAIYVRNNIPQAYIIDGDTFNDTNNYSMWMAGSEYYDVIFRMRIDSNFLFAAEFVARESFGTATGEAIYPGEASRFGRTMTFDAGMSIYVYG